MDGPESAIGQDARMARPPESVRKEGTRSEAEGWMQERKRFPPFALFKRGRRKGEKVIQSRLGKWICTQPPAPAPAQRQLLPQVSWRAWALYLAQTLVGAGVARDGARPDSLCVWGYPL